MTEERRRLAVPLAATALTAAIYVVFLGRRTDYAGHFLAGFGGTLGALGLLLKVLPRTRFERLAGWAVLLGTAGCIALGAALEGSVFRLQRFDPLDFFNQTFGAAFAGAAALLATADGALSEQSRRVGTIAAVGSLAAGFVLAFW